MIKYSTLFCFLIIVFPMVPHCQASLRADGTTNTYVLINSILAPGYVAVEAPDQCTSHPAFGPHIVQVWDADLKENVFEFYAHVNEDNDRCQFFDRQRVEIKTFASSPDSLKGVLGETIAYQWKFRLPIGFKPSAGFTHLHQIKAVGGSEGMPIFTLTARKGNPNKLLLIHDNTTTVATVPLSALEGEWVQATELIKVGAMGTYSLSIKRVSDGKELLAYSSENIMTIRPDNDFIRPKWGIYRSLKSAADLRDEAVRFADFLITEIKLPTLDLQKKQTKKLGE